MRNRAMRWAALLLCALLLAACGSSPKGSTSTTPASVPVDPKTLPSAGTVSATLPSIAGLAEAGNYGIAADDTAVWVHNATKGMVVRVDPKTNQVVATIPVGRGEGDVGLEAGAVWVLNRDDYTVSRIDPATNQIVATIALPQLRSKTIHLRVSLSVSPGAVWVAREDSDVAYKIDTQSNQVAETIYPTGGPAWMAFAAGSLWVCNRDSELFAVTRIDPASHQVLAQIDISGGQYACDGIAASSDGAVWAELVDDFQTTDHGLVRIDPATNKVVTTFLPPESRVISALAADAQGVWVAEPDIGLFHLSAMNKAAGFLSMREASGVAVGAGSVWVLDNDGNLMRVTPAS